MGYWLAVYHERYSGMTEVQAAGTAAGVLAVAGIIGTMWGGRVRPTQVKGRRCETALAQEEKRR